jgi:hypothetical protein
MYCSTIADQDEVMFSNRPKRDEMTIGDLKINRRVHKYMRALGYFCVLVAWAEMLLLWDQLALFLWATAANIAATWFAWRMGGYVQMLTRRIRDAEQRAQLHEALDKNFETIMERTRGRYHYERGRQIIHKKAA